MKSSNSVINIYIIITYLFRYKLKMFEERESHLEAEIISLQEEFNSKLQKQKVFFY